METFATTVYLLCEETLKLLKIKEEPNSKMSIGEVMTFAILAAKYFSSNYKIARYMCIKLRLFPCILSNSRMNHRIHQIPFNCWQVIFRMLAFFFKTTNEKNYFAVDSFPISCCQKNRIDKRKIFLQRHYLGYAASKKRYFCGIKVHMIVTSDGKPVEVYFKPGAESDLNVLWSMELDIPIESRLYADGAYNCFDLEDILQESGIQLLAKRGSRTKQRLRTKEEEKQISSRRQIIETAFSSIAHLLPRYLKVRTEACFLIKVFCTILAYSASFLCKSSLI